MTVSRPRVRSGLAPHRQELVIDRSNATILVWLNRGMESLWLLAVLLAPLIFFNHDYAISEAIIAYVEVPKVALLRTLAGLMAILWIIEWVLRGRFPRVSSGDKPGAWRHPVTLMVRLAAWLRQQPAHWVILAVWLFLGTTLLSTALSGSVSVSLWGEIPGQDSYSAYTIVTFVLLFGIIASHLKTRPQLWRLLGAISATGVLISGYAVLQHYGHDFLGLTESTGGGTGRVTSFMGNAVFSASAMSMPISITLLMATLAFREPMRGAHAQSLREKIARDARPLALMSLWIPMLTVQLLGIIFTFSRGAWAGTLTALAAFLVLAGLFAGWRALGRAAVVLALATALTLAVLEWSGVVGLLVVAGLLATVAVYAIWGTARAVPVLGTGVAVAAVVAVVAFALAIGAGRGPLNPESGNTNTVVNQVGQRFASIKGDVLGGVLAGRGRHWKDSWQLVQERPWFEFDTLSLRWLRPVIGYGPDLFRYTYLLVTPPMAGSLLLIEPDHAHNFLIHQTVEQGILGLASGLGLFVAPLLAGGVLLLRKAHGEDSAQKLVLAGLLATLAGRFVEQMVGVARISDLTIFWALLAALCVLPAALGTPAAALEPASIPSARRRRGGSQPSITPQPRPGNWQLLLRLAMAAWIIGGILSLTWVRSINNSRAAVMAGSALKQLDQGNPQAALAGLDRATALAPDVPVYHNYRASVYSIYRKNDRLPPERGCSQQKAVTYDVCLAQQVYSSNLASVEQRPFYWRSRLALADAAFLLKRYDEAIRLYQEVTNLLPSSWAARNRLANAYIKAGRPEEALKPLAESLAITGENANAAETLVFRGIAYRDLGQFEASTQDLERSLVLSPESGSAQQTKEMLATMKASPQSK